MDFCFTFAGVEMSTPLILICVVFNCARARLISADDEVIGLLNNRRAIRATDLDADGVPKWYPGRPTGICTSRDHKCFNIMANKPYHIFPLFSEPIPGKTGAQGGTRCSGALMKLTKDRFGRPLTMRFTYKRKTYVANREQAPSHVPCFSSVTCLHRSAS